MVSRIQPVWGRFDTDAEQHPEMADSMFYAGLLPDNRVLLPVPDSLEKRVLVAAFKEGELIFNRFERNFVTADFIAKVIPEAAKNALEAQDKVRESFRKIRENMQNVENT